jgi:hypothetical protein
MITCLTILYFNFAVLFYKLHLDFLYPSCFVLDYKLCTFWYGFLDVMEYGVIIEWRSCILFHFLLQNIKTVILKIRAVHKT